MAGTTREKLIKGLKDPKAAWSVVRGRVRGLLFTLWCRLFRPRITIGRNLFLDGKLIIRGPGRVVLGDNVMVSMRVTPFTYDRDAVIEIGSKTFLNGTRFGCKQRVSIGARCILAECRIGDYDFHSVDPEHRNDAAYIKCKPVVIEDNVWIATDCTVLKGVTIGKDSTIMAMSLVRSDVPASCVAGGNPAVVVKELVPR
jgi:acetyltransferase-like isoleucine patch superfamily enzyme